MDPNKLIKRYAVYLRLPKTCVTRIVIWYKQQLVSRGVLGCHSKMKDVCLQLRYWLLATADGVKCVLRAPWVAITNSGFPKLFSGLQHLPNDVLWIITSFHKVFKPRGISELPVKAVKARYNDAVTPFTGSKAAITDALSLIEIGTRHLHKPGFDDYSIDSGSIYDPNHELLPNGIMWLHAFYERNKNWLQPVEGVQCFYPYNPTKEPEVPSGGCYESFSREGNVVSWCDPSFTVMGEYQMSAEPGFKARAFFAPNLLVQAVSEPLYNFLKEVEKTSGYSVRYLETEAKVSQVQEWFQEGAVVASIDQTSATDRFPLSLQLYTAHCLGVDKEYIRFISKVSRGRWLIQESLQGIVGASELRLAVGQPMGLSFSMPLYTLAMIALLKGACARWGYNPDFLVLGDDLVVRGHELAQWCHDFLPKIGVSISLTKGVTSCNVAEFAGAIVGKDFYTFPGKMPIVDNNSWYACSTRFAQPLPDGCPVAKSDLTVEEAFWLSRVAALGCYAGTSCPIENRYACNSIIQQHGFTEEHLSMLIIKGLEYDIRRIRDSARSLVGSVRKGLVTSKSDAIVRMCETLVDHDLLFRVLEREDDLLRKGFKMTVSRVSYQLRDVIGMSSASGFESWLKPKGDSTAVWVAHVLSRVADVLKLDSPNWSTKYSSLAQRVLISSIAEIMDRLRELLWERRGRDFDRVISKQSSFCHYLLAS